MHEPKLDSTPCTIRTRRAMLLTRHGEPQARHAAEGEEITIERHWLACLDPADFDMLGSAPPAPPALAFDI